MDKPWKVIAAFLGVFIAGAVFGGFFTVGVGARWVNQLAPTATPAATVPSAPVPTPTPAPAAVAASAPAAGSAKAPQTPAQKAAAALLQVPQSWQAPALLRRYAERLELTPEQRQRIHPLIQRATEDYNRLRQTTFRETAIILQRLQQDIAQELTPDQREKLKQIEEKQRETMKKIEPRQKEQKKGGGAGKGAGFGRPAPTESTEATGAAKSSAPTEVSKPSPAMPESTATTSTPSTETEKKE
jgi:Spy/CpxP family protein refolding chaperone